MTAAWLMFRRHRLWIAAWAVLLVALSGGTVSAYQSTYKTPEKQRTAVEFLQHDTATTLLYGRLPDPGTPAQMFAWEIGAIVTLLVAVMAVLLAVALTRAAEEDGTLELLLTYGADRRTPIRSACAVLFAVAGVLAVGCALAVGPAAGRVDAVTWPGALNFGSVVGVTFLVTGTLTAVFAQIVTTARAARLLGLAAMGVAFAVRVFADTQGAGWLNWLSPLALRTTAGPFTQDRWWVLAVDTIAAAALACLAARLSDRREYGAGLLPARNTSDARLNIRSGLGLIARISRGTVLAWTVAVTCIGTLFAAMGSTAVQQSRQGDLEGFLGAQLESGDPAAAYFAYCGTFVGMVVSAFAVLTVLRAGRDEHDGLTDHVLATGVRRWQPLAWSVAAAASGSAVILLATGTASALIAPMTITGTDIAVRAFAYCVGQWPAATAAAGWTALLVGLRPRAAWLAWAPLAVSGVFALLGRLLGVPGSVQDLGIFQHVPDSAMPSPDVRGLAVLLAVSALTTLAGIAATTRRDITVG
ncbi:ABC transporter permease subunit [Actinomadura scrupuli]|uniref:ABC transporter permease subunit n=1 Tax=Actinomadura scrupuli TaxID=559629 RepID=UPI003D9576B1